MALLIEMVGGQAKAARIARVDPDTINNWRKEGSRVPIQGVLPLAVEARVSLDWVAGGYQVRPDLEANLRGHFGEPGTSGDGPAPGFVRLRPVRPEIKREAGALVERWTPPDIAVSEEWLDRRFRLSGDTARYAIASDGGMEPLVAKDAFLIVDARPAPLRSGVYVIAVGDELLARRLHRLPDGRAELVADAQPAWRFSLPGDGSEGMMLCRVVWCGQEL